MEVDCLPRPDTVEDFAETLADASTVAVVSPPWHCREAILSGAESSEAEAPDSVRISLDATTEQSPELPDADLILVDDCHHLFSRRVGGFEQLETFAAAVAATDATVVTSWNDAAWTYLTNVTEISRVFEDVYEIPPLDTEDALALLKEYTGSEDPVAGLEPYEERSVGAETGESRISRMWRTVGRQRHDPETGPIAELVAHAAGNPRAICHLFECRAGEGVDGRPGEPDVDYDGSYLLWLVLANEGASVSTLSARVESPVEPPLATLRRQGIVTISDGEVALCPEAYRDVVAQLERRRLLW